MVMRKCIKYAQSIRSGMKVNSTIITQYFKICHKYPMKNRLYRRAILRQDDRLWLYK
jgi:hypothetical protein